MVALFRDIITDEPCGIHRTYLDVAGRKLDRKMLGRAKGAAIKLDPDADVTTGLSIGEGIETTLTGRAAGFRPAWALGSAGAIASFPVLSGLEVITVFAEHDKSGANQRAIEQLAQRYTAAGCEVFILQPTNGDLNTAVDLRGAA